MQCLQTGPVSRSSETLVAEPMPLPRPCQDCLTLSRSGVRQPVPCSGTERPLRLGRTMQCNSVLLGIAQNPSQSICKCSASRLVLTLRLGESKQPKTIWVDSTSPPSESIPPLAALSRWCSSRMIGRSEIFLGYPSESQLLDSCSWPNQWVDCEFVPMKARQSRVAGSQVRHRGPCEVGVGVASGQVAQGVSHAPGQDRWGCERTAEAARFPPAGRRAHDAQAPASTRWG
jgi:hypothetical protein